MRAVLAAAAETATRSSPCSATRTTTRASASRRPAPLGLRCQYPGAVGELARVPAARVRPGDPGRVPLRGRVRRG